MPSSKNRGSSFEKGVLKTIQFLEKEKINYFILGGLAVSIIGEPRFTYDLDLDVFFSKENVPDLLKKVKQASFKVRAKEAFANVQTFGTFRMFWEDLQIDIILASTELEKTALKRRKNLTLFGKRMSFPSPEDLILLKIIPGRQKDMMDVESIILRYKGKLDIVYLEKWAQRISDEAEDYRVWHALQKLLKK